jgi:hypothetical protein
MIVSVDVGDVKADRHHVWKQLISVCAMCDKTATGIKLQFVPARRNGVLIQQRLVRASVMICQRIRNQFALGTIPHEQPSGDT